MIFILIYRLFFLVTLTHTYRNVNAVCFEINKRLNYQMYCIRSGLLWLASVINLGNHDDATSDARCSMLNEQYPSQTFSFWLLVQQKLRLSGFNLVRCFDISSEKFWNRVPHRNITAQIFAQCSVKSISLYFSYSYLMYWYDVFFV